MRLPCKLKPKRPCLGKPGWAQVYRKHFRVRVSLRIDR